MNLYTTNIKHYITLLVFVPWLFILGCHTRYIPPMISGLSLDGFEQIDPLIVYNKDNLFAYMNGEAEAYLPLGFQVLYLLRYENVKTNIPMIVEVYDMGGRSGAEGIFQQYTQDGGLAIKDLGDKAWTDNYIVLMRRGESFLRITPDYSSSLENSPKVDDLIEFGRSMDGALSNER
ncbi:MAG: hypothetical protein JW932_13645 [Deltaproteobacteria bacterium]|nr:hypothetical protein [Deltaproteobacteria bacterium]